MTEQVEVTSEDVGQLAGVLPSPDPTPTPVAEEDVIERRRFFREQARLRRGAPQQLLLRSTLAQAWEAWNARDVAADGEQVFEAALKVAGVTIQDDPATS